MPNNVIVANQWHDTASVGFVAWWEGHFPSGATLREAIIQCARENRHHWRKWLESYRQDKPVPFPQNLDKQVLFRLPGSTWEELQSIAKSIGKTPSDMLRAASEAIVTANRKG